MESPSFTDRHGRGQTGEVCGVQLLFPTLKGKERTTNKACRQPLEAGRTRKQIPPWSPQKDTPANALPPTHGDPCRTCEQQDSVIMNLHFWKPPGVARCFSRHEERTHRAGLRSYRKRASSHPVPSGQCSWSTIPLSCVMGPHLSHLKGGLYPNQP